MNRRKFVKRVAGVITGLAITVGITKPINAKTQGILVKLPIKPRLSSGNFGCGGWSLGGYVKSSKMGMNESIYCYKCGKMLAYDVLTLDLFCSNCKKAFSRSHNGKHCHVDWFDKGWVKLNDYAHDDKCLEYQDKIVAYAYYREFDVA